MSLCDGIEEGEVVEDTVLSNIFRVSRDDLSCLKMVFVAGASKYVEGEEEEGNEVDEEIEVEIGNE